MIIRIEERQTSDNTNRLPNSCIILTWWRNAKVEHKLLQDYEAKTTLKQNYKAKFCSNGDNNFRKR